MDVDPDDKDVSIVTHTTERQVRWPVWASSVDDLGVVVRRMADMAAKGCQVALDSVDPDDPRAERMRRAIEESWRVRGWATYPALRQTVTGPPEKLLQQLDPKTIDTLRISTETRAAWDDEATIRVIFRRSERAWYDDRFGAELFLKSQDYGWVQEATNSLTVAIRRGVPWWAFLRGRLSPWLYGIVAGLAVFLATFGHIGGFSVIAAEGCGVVFIWASPWVQRHWFPAFEVLPAGSKARGARGVAVVGSLAGQLVIGAIVGLVVH